MNQELQTSDINNWHEPIFKCIKIGINRFFKKRHFFKILDHLERRSIFVLHWGLQRPLAVSRGISKPKSELSRDQTAVRFLKINFTCGILIMAFMATWENIAFYETLWCIWTVTVWVRWCNWELVIAHLNPTSKKEKF